MAKATTKKYPYSITEICLTFLYKQRFYATILSRMVKIETQLIPTAGVGFNKHGKLSLYYNPDWLLNMPLNKAQTIIEHEVLHIFFRHLTRHPKEGTSTSAWLDDIKNMGCDCAINQYLPNLPTVGDSMDIFVKMLNEDTSIPESLKTKIKEEMAKKPANRDEVDGQTPDLHGFPKEQSADFYIEELKKKYPQKQQQQSQNCPQCGQPQQQQGQQQSQQQQGQGQSQQQGQQPQQSQGQGKGQGKSQQQQQGSQGQQSGQGQPQQGQGSSQGQGQQSQQQQGQGQNNCPCCGQPQGQGQGQGKPQKGKGQSQGQAKGLGRGFDSHDLWNQVLDENNGQLTSVEDLDFDPEYETVSVIQKAIKECKDFGNIPEFVRREIEELQKPVNRYSWKHELKVFVNSMLAATKRLSQKRVNRRFANQRYILPGKKKARRPSILVARDTSGSVFDDETQNEFLNEMINISKYATIHVCDCDTIIHQTYEVRKRKDFKEYKGGGGTAFEPVFKKAKELGVDGIIYLTDTQGSFPKKEDIGKFAQKTIWCTIDTVKVEIPFGKHVNIPVKNKG